MDISQLKPVRAARLLFQLPRNCRVFTKLQPANNWGWAEMLANKTTYLLELLLWQNSYDPKKKAKHKAAKPKPFIPDFLQPKQPPSAINKDAAKSNVEDVKNILSMPRG